MQRRTSFERLLSPAFELNAPLLAALLPALLAAIGDVDVLEVDGLTAFRYASVYFDTDSFDSYLGAARRRPTVEGRHLLIAPIHIHCINALVPYQFTNTSKS